jgi:hypothetical protein
MKFLPDRENLDIIAAILTPHVGSSLSSPRPAAKAYLDMRRVLDEEFLVAYKAATETPGGKRDRSGENG